MEAQIKVTIGERKESDGGLFQPGDHELLVWAKVDGHEGTTRIISGSKDDRGRLLDILSQIGMTFARITGNLDLVIDVAEDD